MPVLLGERRISVGEIGWKKRRDAKHCVSTPDGNFLKQKSPDKIQAFKVF
jgi:hypothetical protein